MKLGRTFFAALLAFALAACGGDDSGGSGAIGGNTADCSLSARQDWVRSTLDQWYLYPELLNTSVNKASHSTLQSYIDAMTAPGQSLFDPDNLGSKTFTYITSIKEENELINSGANAGFGVRLIYDTSANRVFISEAFETAPAFKAGFDRGTEILQIGGQTVSSLMASGGAPAVSDALGPSDPGVTRSFVIRSVTGVEQTVSVTKAEYSLDPISDRYGVRILDDGAGGKVGYINLRTFIVQNAEPQLRSAFDQFRSQGITNVILDMRYNGGGLVSVANLLGDLMGDGLEGRIFSETKYRPSKSASDSRELFEEQSEQIATMKLAVIGRGGTASASELVTNSMIPYLGNNIALIGTDTYGKPVGQSAFDRTACDDRLRAVTFKTVNAAGQGDYFGGLASVMPNTCAAPDDIFDQLGDPAEQSVSVALDFLAGRSCTPISAAAKDGSAKAEGPPRELLRATRPSAAQLEIPGLF